MDLVQDGPDSHNGRARHERNLHFLVGDHLWKRTCIGHGLGRETLAKPVPDRSTRACALRIMILAVDMMLNKQQGLYPPPSGTGGTYASDDPLSVPTGRHGRSFLRPQSLGQVPIVIVCQEWNYPDTWQASLPILGFSMTPVMARVPITTKALHPNWLHKLLWAFCYFSRVSDSARGWM